MTRLRRPAVAVALVALMLSGCSFTGINSRPLPFTKGNGPNDVRATVYLENAVNLVPNSEVKFDDLTVGSVRKIEFDRGRAKLTIGIEKDAKVPADIDATIAQKSLLGAEYLELSSDAAPSAPRLRTGATLGLDRTGRYPETEEVLSGAALLLNGGGLPQIRTITHELNAALNGREGDVRSLISQLDRFTGTLNDQKANIISVLEQTNRLAKVIANDRGTVTKALDELPAGIDTLVSERRQLVKTLSALSDFSTIAHRVVTETQGDLVKNLEAIRPITKDLADSGQKLIDASEAITYPFPTIAVSKSFFGDYINLFVTFDVNPKDFVKVFLGGTPLDGIYTGLIGGLPTGPAAEALDPLTSGLLGEQNKNLDNLDGGLSSSISKLVKGLAGSAKPSSGSSNTTDPTPTTGTIQQMLQQLLGGS